LVEQLIRGEATTSFQEGGLKRRRQIVLDDDRVMYIEEQIGRFWREENFWRRRIEFERKSWNFDRKSWSFDKMGSRCEIRTDCGRCNFEMHRGEAVDNFSWREARRSVGGKESFRRKVFENRSKGLWRTTR
jgi:hypothetical protein